MNRLSTTERSFLDVVQKIFSAPEVLVVVRYVYGSGNREFLILKNITEFHDLVRNLRKRDSVVVMKWFRKIKEGKVDQAFIDNAVTAWLKGSHWILIGKDNFEHTPQWAYAESEGELREQLQDRMGNQVCIVNEPDYTSEQDSIGAYVPDEDGIVRPGAY